MDVKRTAYTTKQPSDYQPLPVPEPPKPLVYVHPVNGHVEEVRLSWLWTLLFGMLYFVSKGLWRHVVIQVLIFAFFAALTPFSVFVVFALITHLVYVWLAEPIVVESLLRQGYQPAELSDPDDPTSWKIVRTEFARSPEPAQKERVVRACPFCAEDILAVALKCKHCGSVVGPLSAPSAAPADQ